ncbi:unnamed protein product [Caretta caretta]
MGPLSPWTPSPGHHTAPSPWTPSPGHHAVLVPWTPSPGDHTAPGPHRQATTQPLPPGPHRQGTMQSLSPGLHRQGTTQLLDPITGDHTARSPSIPAPKARSTLDPIARGPHSTQFLIPSSQAPSPWISLPGDHITPGSHRHGITQHPVPRSQLPKHTASGSDHTALG